MLFNFIPQEYFFLILSQPYEKFDAIIRSGTVTH